MYDIEREKKILEILKEHGTIGINKLASLVFCSSSTIRRDLNKLEKRGLVKRSFGFVSLASEVGTEETSFSNREIVNISIKKKLSKVASKELNNSQTIFIDSSTTLLFIAPYLNEYKNLLIITNGLRIASEIINHTNHKVILIGGEIEPHTYSSLGSSAIADVSNFHADIALFSCSGVSISFGFSEASYDIAEIKKKMIENSTTKIFVFDKSKYGQNKTFKTCDIDNADTIIVPNDLDKLIIEEIKKKGINVIICPE